MGGLGHHATMKPLWLCGSSSHRFRTVFVVAKTSRKQCSCPFSHYGNEHENRFRVRFRDSKKVFVSFVRVSQMVRKQTRHRSPNLDAGSPMSDSHLPIDNRSTSMLLRCHLRSILGEYLSGILGAYLRGILEAYFWAQAIKSRYCENL